MALVIQSNKANAVSDIATALEYAGGALADLTVESGTDCQGMTGAAIIKDGTHTIASVCIGDNNYGNFSAHAYASDSVHFGYYGGYSQKNVLKVVATKSAVAFINPPSSGQTILALIITTDNNGDYCCVVKTGSSVSNLNDPTIIPRDSRYTAEIKYIASTSTVFGCTALSKIPVPTYDGSAKYLPNVAFAHATQYQVDGSVMLNGTQKFYCIGGSWYIDDSEGVQT